MVGPNAAVSVGCVRLEGPQRRSSWTTPTHAGENGLEESTRDVETASIQGLKGPMHNLCYVATVWRARTGFNRARFAGSTTGSPQNPGSRIVQTC